MAKARTCTLNGTQLEQQAAMVAQEPGGLDALRGLIAGMIGPSTFLTNFALTQPDDFYIDDRANGFGQYKPAAIVQAVQVYAIACRFAGVEPGRGPNLPNLGTF